MDSFLSFLHNYVVHIQIEWNILNERFLLTKRNARQSHIEGLRNYFSCSPVYCSSSLYEYSTLFMFSAVVTGTGNSGIDWNSSENMYISFFAMFDQCLIYCLIYLMCSSYCSKTLDLKGRLLMDGMSWLTLGIFWVSWRKTKYVLCQEVWKESQIWNLNWP